MVAKIGAMIVWNTFSSPLFRRKYTMIAMQTRISMSTIATTDSPLNQ